MHGDQPAAGSTELERILAEHHSSATAYATSLCGDESHAHDLVADAYLRIWERLRAGTIIRHPRSYLQRTIFHLYIDHYRKTKRTTSVDWSDQPDHRAGVVPDFADQLAQSETLHRCMAGLPSRQRLALQLQLSGYSLGEIAALLELPSSGATAILVFRARRTLRAALNDAGSRFA
jgi:RNA polymerase sigma factor (sigma-70 family)